MYSFFFFFSPSCILSPMYLLASNRTFPDPFFSSGAKVILSGKCFKMSFSVKPFIDFKFWHRLKSLMNLLLTSLNLVKNWLVFLNRMHFLKIHKHSNNVFAFNRQWAKRFWENSPDFMDSKHKKFCFVSKY